MTQNPVSPQHNNNFNLLRWLFANAVVFSHSFALVGIPEPTIWGRTVGNISVQGFFVISGYLICASFISRPAIFPFAVNRMLRIVPGVVVAVVLSHLVWLACDRFQFNPVPWIYNGPVWTINWEAVCYLLIAVLGLIGVLTSAAMPAFFASAWLVYLVNISNVSDGYLVIAPLFMCFIFGGFIRTMGGRVNLKLCAIPAIIVLAVTANTSVFSLVIGFLRKNVLLLWGPSIADHDILQIIFLLAFPVLVLFIGNGLPHLIKIKNDISYGIYLYGWPVSQVIVYLFLGIGIDLHATALFVYTMAITLPIAWVSWLLVEQPALKLKGSKIFAEKIRPQFES